MRLVFKRTYSLQQYFSIKRNFPPESDRRKFEDPFAKPRQIRQTFKPTRRDHFSLTLSSDSARYQYSNIPN